MGDGAVGQPRSVFSRESLSDSSPAAGRVERTEVENVSSLPRSSARAGRGV